MSGGGRSKSEKVRVKKEEWRGKKEERKKTGTSRGKSGEPADGGKVGEGFSSHAMRMSLYFVSSFR